MESARLTPSVAATSVSLKPTPTWCGTLRCPRQAAEVAPLEQMSAELKEARGIRRRRWESEVAARPAKPAKAAPAYLQRTPPPPPSPAVTLREASAREPPPSTKCPLHGAREHLIPFALNFGDHWKMHSIFNADKDAGACRGTPMTLQPYLNAFHSKGMPGDLYDLCEALITRPLGGKSPWQPVGQLGVVYHKGNLGHCSYLQFVCYKCMQMTQALFLQDKTKQVSQIRTLGWSSTMPSSRWQHVSAA